MKTLLLFIYLLLLLNIFNDAPVCRRVNLPPWPLSAWVNITQPMRTHWTKNYVDGVDSCNIVYAGLRLLEFYLLNSWQCVYSGTWRLKPSSRHRTLIKSCVTYVNRWRNSGHQKAALKFYDLGSTRLWSSAEYLTTRSIRIHTYAQTFIRHEWNFAAPSQNKKEFRRDLWHQKTRAIVCVVCVILRLAVLVQYGRVTDGRTDGHTTTAYCPR